jgi:hypothetical protein
MYTNQARAGAATDTILDEVARSFIGNNSSRINMNCKK